MGFLGLATDWNRCRVWQSIYPFALSTDAFPSYALIQKNARTIPLVDNRFSKRGDEPQVFFVANEVQQDSCSATERITNEKTWQATIRSFGYTRCKTVPVVTNGYVSR